MKKKNLFLIIFVFVLIAVSILYSTNDIYSLKRNGKYTIATLDDFRGGGKGCGVSIDLHYFYKGDKYEQKNVCQHGRDISSLYRGQKFLIEFIPYRSSYIYIFFRNDVATNFMQIPFEGWNRDSVSLIFPAISLENH
jgi:hypothetical protein